MSQDRHWYICTYNDGDDLEPFVHALVAEGEEEAQEEMWRLCDAMLWSCSRAHISVVRERAFREASEPEDFFHLDMRYGPFTPMQHPIHELVERLVQKGVLRR